MSIEITSSNIRTWSRTGQAGAFGIAALALPEINENIVFLSADLGVHSGLERFMQQYPDRFYNMGIAEQNMIGVAAGMANEGMQLFATTFAAFASSRCMDQVSVCMGYMQQGIKLIGMTSGLSAGALGATHTCTRDVATMRAVPNITILSPADGLETIKATLALATYDGPVYMRLAGGWSAPIVYRDDYKFDIGKMIKLREGDDITIFATGPMVYNSLKAAESLESENLSVGVINVHTIKPLDTDAIMDTIKSKLIVTIEEHSVVGGLGSAISEHLAQLRDAPPQLILGIPDECPKAGEYQWLLEQLGLTPEIIKQQILKKYRELLSS